MLKNYEKHTAVKTVFNFAFTLKSPGEFTRLVLFLKRDLYLEYVNNAYKSNNKKNN